MRISRLMGREIGYRRWSFGLSVLSIALAAGAIVAGDFLVRHNAAMMQITLAQKQDETERAVQEKQAEVAAAGAALEDAIRKQMKGLGFNVLILPASQDVSELHLQGALTETMPASFAERLADSKIMTINHLLPTVMSRVRWDEQDLDVVLYGTRGEVPLLHRDLKKPVLEPVSNGQIVVGHTLHQKLKLEVGQTVSFQGREFTVSRLHPERGSIDDVTVWIDLEAAQEILGMQNLIHAILALECECAGDRIAQIRAEITEILPGTQVIERYSQALARAESRTTAKQMAEQSLQAEKMAGEAAVLREWQARKLILLRLERFAYLLSMILLLVAAGTVGILAYQNVRQRREEIGILRALGLRTTQLLSLFLMKASLAGVLGGLVGIGLGLVAVWGVTIWPGQAESQLGLTGTFWSVLGERGSREVLISTPLLMVGLAVVSSWVAAVRATQQDAAVVLRGE